MLVDAASGPSLWMVLAAQRVAHLTVRPVRRLRPKRQTLYDLHSSLQNRLTFLVDHALLQTLCNNSDC